MAGSAPNFVPLLFIKIALITLLLFLAAPHISSQTILRNSRNKEISADSQIFFSLDTRQDPVNFLARNNRLLFSNECEITRAVIFSLVLFKRHSKNLVRFRFILFLEQVTQLLHFYSKNSNDYHRAILSNLRLHNSFFFLIKIIS